MAVETFFNPARREVWKRAANHGAFAVVPIIVTAFLVRLVARDHNLAVDFRHGPWVAGKAILNGISPYVSPHSPQVVNGSPFVYPVLAAFVLLPLSLLSQGTADTAFTALSMLAVIGCLAMLNVRDWRIYGVAFLWPPVASGWQTANLTLLLTVGVAALWRYRDRSFASGLLLAVLVSIKVFVWPLGLWFLATRRYSSLAYAALAGLALNIVAWAAVGFDQIARYGSLMRSLTDVQDGRGYSPLALALRFLDQRPAYALATGVAVPVVGLCLWLGRHGQERSAFSLAVAACLLVSPIVWLHYFALLLVPVGIAYPRLSLVWLLPLLTWLFPPSSPHTWQVAVALGVAAVVTWLTIEPRPARRLLAVPSALECNSTGSVRIGHSGPLDAEEAL